MRRFKATVVRAALSISCALVLLTTAHARAAEPAARAFDISPQSLAAALGEFARQSHREILFTPDVVANKSSGGARGTMQPLAALHLLLNESGLAFTTTPNGAILVGAPPAGEAKPPHAATSPAAETSSSPLGSRPGRQRLRFAQMDASSREDAASSAVPDSRNARRANPDAPSSSAVDEVVVTGSHIRNTTLASPVIVISQQQIREAGHTDLGQVARSIPQNFSGGQNPGIGLGATDSRNTNMNITGASALNLRGLGPDATLTLLNGHRLSYGSFTQSVDISTIPIDAIDRMEVVADGASALYGSDAVGGVANIILQRDYSGVSASARVGSATSGGNYQRQYSIVGGGKWEGGGAIATFNTERDTSIRSSQRARTAYLPEPYMLMAGQKVYSFLASGHQSLSERVEVSLDALYSNRRSLNRYSSPPTIGGTDRDETSYTVAPAVTLQLAADWQASISGVLARDRADIGNTTFSADWVVQSDAKYCWCNSAKSIEADAEGPVFDLPGGEVRLALGAGYRRNEFDNRYEYSTRAYYDASGDRESSFAFGEISLPLVSSRQAIPFVRRLVLNAAVRHENYSDFGAVTTPKVGLVYSPTADADVKITWGRSFKTPNLWQQYQSTATYLYRSTSLGGSSAVQTALLVYGGNPDLQPENATTWSASLAFHPQRIPGLRIEPAYFNIEYRDRVALPIATFSVALSSPSYQEFVTRTPSAEQQQQFIAAATLGLQNLSGLPYVTGDVIAAVNDLYTNVAAQRLYGVDLPITYSIEMGPDALSLTSQMSWLHGQQRNTSQSVPFPIAGVIYNPPHFKGRLGASWTHGALTLASFYNYLGAVVDNRTTPNPRGSAMRTVDLSVLYSSASERPLLRGLGLSFSVLNATNESPPYLRNSIDYHMNFDSSNYSIIGRFVGLSISKRW